MKRLTLLLFTTILLGAQPAVAPILPDSLRARYWRAAADLVRAQNNMQSVTTEIVTLCGKNFHPGMDQNSEPTCVPIVKTPSPENK